VGGHQAPDRARYGDAFDPLISAATSGAPWAWERLYQWLAPAVIGYLRSQGLREAEDVASEVWVGIFRNIDRFAGDETQFRSWVFVIAHRRLQDERRRLARHPEGPSPTPDSGPFDHTTGTDAEAMALSRLAAERLQGFCSGLAPDQRDVVLLRTVGDLTVEQAAEVLGKSPGAIKALQRRGFGRLRKMLADEGVTL
jgi:RNA polymerase sigma factor (sigma-70 family)